ncbi:hydantoinase/oxoprolinase family protein [Arthrobacter sp. MI7-26]|uniref:hydantoinase/oxoprolinase family protein n=1 Tax=Arthrobacter sp. MI7-26 TaxID=2993653 RepID=UPI002248C62D|nr:hydantoinase/oxoprolinase family protein [Arthrobacter sp. MI7-26]MCX2750339.1 hydantoinase/oxoprolinase family protein [Arthrobacter sp. MI7-26]
MAYRLGVDVGGTFTDVLLVHDESGESHRAKTPSTPKDQSIGVLNGIEQVCAKAGIAPDEVERIMHGTTVATNAILEGRGARVGLVTTEGFRQILQVGRSHIPGGLGSWIMWPKPLPLALLEDTVEALERIDTHGSVERELDESDIRVKLERLRDSGIEALTIALINSFANDEHEKRILRIAEELMPNVPISLSSQILPEIREYERTNTTVANSYVRPEVGRYLYNLERSLSDKGIDANLHIVRSDGGLESVTQAEEAPVTLLMSGPAGGVAGAVAMAKQSGFENLLTFDMGGTSTDVALVENGVPRIGRDTLVGDLTVRASSVDIRTVGAGGGSIAHVPQLTGALRVGPHSAGAEPGPACYGKGGELPTVTDANVVLGYLPPSLLGGQMSLDVEAARRSVKQIAAAIGLPDEETAAAGIIDIVNEAMFGALRLVSVQQGYDPRDFALVAFGGAGPLHGNALARLMGSWPLIVPPSPGVLCAYGDVATDLRSESARTFMRRFAHTSDSEVQVLLDELASEAQASLDAEEIPRDQQQVTFEIDVRYSGQGFEVPIEFGSSRLEDIGGLPELGRRFNEEHQRLFLFATDAEHEIVNIRAVASANPTHLAVAKIPYGGSESLHALVDTVKIWVDGAFVEAGHYDRTALLAGNVVNGPAVITEMDSTTLVLPGHSATTDPSGNLLIRPTSES